MRVKLQIALFLQTVHEIAGTSTSSAELPDDEECDARNDDSSTAAGTTKLKSLFINQFLFNYALTRSSFNRYGLVCFSKISFTSGLQLPQPIPAPLIWHNALNSLHPSFILLMIFPSPTLFQLQTSLPITGSAFTPERNNCNRFSLSSILFCIRSRYSRNSVLSPIKIAPIRRSL